MIDRMRSEAIPAHVGTDQRGVDCTTSAVAIFAAAADRLCHTYYLEDGVPVVIARIFICYGPRETEP